MTNASETKPRQAGMSLALFAALQRHLPRGKAAIPRFLGKRLGAQTRYLTTKHGAKLVMANVAYDIYATMALNNYSWEYSDFQACCIGLGDDQVFYDVGANVGYYTIEMAHLLPDARVVAFEPQPELVEAITASVDLNQLENVQVVPALVGDSPRTTELYLAPSSIHASAVPDSGRPTRHGTLIQRMVTLDDLVTSGEIPDPDFVKIDVEGSEHLVFRGAATTFRKSRPHIYLEYLHQFDVGLRVRKEVELLAADAGYQLFGWPQKPLLDKRGWQFSPLTSGDDWNWVWGVFMRQSDRPVRRPEAFRH